MLPSHREASDSYLNIYNNRNTGIHFGKAALKLVGRDKSDITGGRFSP